MIRGLSSFWDDLVATGNDLSGLLELIVRRAAEVLGEATVLATVSEDGDTLEPAAVFHADPEVREFIRAVLASAPYPIGEGVAGGVAARREPALVPHVDPALLAAVQTPHMEQFLERHPIRSLVIVPMVAFGEVIGTLGAVRMQSELPYDDEDVMVLEALAERAALALAEARRQPRRIGPAEYEAMFRQSIDGVLFTAPDGRVLAANPAACTILGRTEADICRIGRAGILVDDPRTKAAVARRAVRGSERAELRMRRGDGEIFIADVSSTVFTTADGELRASVIFRDMSERVRAQAALEKQHHHLELLHRVTRAINEATDLTTAFQRTLDAVGDATGWPLGDVFLLSKDGALRPSPAWRVVDPVHFGWFRCWMQPLTLTAERGLARRVVTTAVPVWESDLDSSPDFVRGQTVPGVRPRAYVGVPIMVGTSVRGVLELFSDEPTPRDDGLLSVLSDLGTQLGRSLERSEVEAAHRRIDDERSAFVARAAHELRSPIASLMVAAGVLAGHELPDPQDRKLLGLVVDSAAHLDRLVNRLLDLSTLELATPVLTIEPVDLSQVVERALSYCPAPPTHSVTCRIPPGTKAMADELSLEEILTNLVGNAYNYGGEKVRIDAQSEDGHVMLSVWDNGPGVDPALEPSLFEPFVRGSSQRGDGTGLGLAISKRLAEAMGGVLRHERHERDGSRFVVELPAEA